MAGTGVRLGPLVLRNPVIAASGTFGFLREYVPYVDPQDLGAVVLKTITLEPRRGNPPPRITETPAGLLNTVGLQNPGLEVFVEEILPALRRYAVPLIVSIAGFTVDEFYTLAARLDAVPGIAALELNISCPNVKAGGMAFGIDPGAAAAAVAAARSGTTLPLIAKLTPNAADIAAVARRVVEAGADIVSLINTLKGMAIDLVQRRPVFKSVFGGLSGPAIKPVALRAVWEVYEAVDVPLIGMGGITTWQDAVEFILAGATAVGVGSANLVNPRATVEIAAGITTYLEENGIEELAELVGAAHRWEEKHERP